ncbi:MAG: DUF4349 domain-containing protein, partial [Odoribacter sp.]|nr:DUF4349 domain-containing protein [Odoribacter sp.]
KIKTYKGYISNETTHKYYDRNEYNITIRVTAQNFDTLVNWISNRVGKLDSKNIRVMDVTETFIDLETRIKTKKELEERYKELLKQAKTVKEVLEIEQQIGYLRAEIESFEGRFKYLSDRISYSTLTLVFYEKIENQSGRDYSFGKEIVNAFKSG